MSPSVVTKRNGVERLITRAGFRSLKAFSQACGLSYNTVCKIANGTHEGRVKSFFVMADVIAEGLDIPPEQAMLKLREAMEA